LFTSGGRPVNTAILSRAYLFMAHFLSALISEYMKHNAAEMQQWPVLHWRYTLPALSLAASL
jgi:hypothetical protein